MELPFSLTIDVLKVSLSEKLYQSVRYVEN